MLLCTWQTERTKCQAVSSFITVGWKRILEPRGCIPHVANLVLPHTNSTQPVSHQYTLPGKFRARKTTRLSRSRFTSIERTRRPRALLSTGFILNAITNQPICSPRAAGDLLSHSTQTYSSIQTCLLQQFLAFPALLGTASPPHRFRWYPPNASPLRPTCQRLRPRARLGNS